MARSYDAPSLPQQLICYTLTPPPSTAASSSSSSSTASTASTAAPSVLSIIDLAVANPHSALLSLRTPVPSPRNGTLTLLSPSASASSATLLHADAHRGLVHAHRLNAPSLQARLMPPAPIACLCASPDGSYLAASSALDGQLWIWSTLTSSSRSAASAATSASELEVELVASWQAAYRPIDCITWSHDSCALITAGQDSRISVWHVANLLAKPSEPSPYALLTDHALPVTSIAAAGVTGAMTGRMWSASKDGTIKTWSLKTRKLVSTHILPYPAHFIVVDPTARFIFAAASSAPSGGAGLVLKVDLISPSSGWTEGPIAHTNGDSGDGHAASTTQVQVGGTPTAMTLSPCGTLLLVGTTNTTLSIIDIHTFQVLRNVDLSPEVHAQTTSASSSSSTAKRHVSNLVCLARPNGSVGTSAGSATADHKKRRMDRLGRGLGDQCGELHFALHGSQRAGQLRAFLTPPSRILSRPEPVRLTKDAEKALQPSVAQISSTDKQMLEAQMQEIASLRAQLEKATKVNEELWKVAVEGTAGANGGNVPGKASTSKSKRRKQ